MLALLLTVATPAFADDVRDFSPNRPSRSDSPFTVPTGLVQVETDLANYTHTGAVLQALDPTILYGLSHLADVEVTIGGLVRQQADGGTALGFGDVVVRLKLSLLGDDGGPVSVSVAPFVKVPTARAPIGNEVVEGGVNVPILFALPAGLGLTVEPGVDALRDATGEGSQASFTGVVNLGRKIVGDLSGFVEVYGQGFAGGGASKPQATFDFGLAYLVTKTVQIDVGENLGLNRATPTLNIYTGLAFRF